jgi:hypothetical protein
MHIIIGLHSLPGGDKDLDIGEAFGYDGWLVNATNLEYSFKAVDAVLSFFPPPATWALLHQRSL